MHFTKKYFWDEVLRELNKIPKTHSIEKIFCESDRTNLKVKYLCCEIFNIGVALEITTLFLVLKQNWFVFILTYISKLSKEKKVKITQQSTSMLRISRNTGNNLFLERNRVRNELHM